METTINNNKQALVADLKPLDREFSMSSNNQYVLICHVSRAVNDKQYTMYTHTGVLVTQWIENLN